MPGGPSPPFARFFEEPFPEAAFRAGAFRARALRAGV